METIGNEIIFSEDDQAAAHLPARIPLDRALDVFNGVNDERLQTSDSLAEVESRDVDEMGPDHLREVVSKMGRLFRLSQLTLELGEVVAPQMVEEMISQRGQDL